MHYNEHSTKAEDLSSSKSDSVAQHAELESEQTYVTMLYDRLDALRERARQRLDDVLGAAPVDNLQGPLEREDFAMQHRIDAARFASVERGLCFGRLDVDPGSDLPGDRLYVGRVGLLDDEYDPLLVDWRAPAAQPFYRATYADRQQVRRRRHIHTRGRVVTGLDDDVLDLSGYGDGERAGLMGEGALLASLAAGRTGRMSDIVATIQAEQDRIIRSGLQGVMVVEGGPGTGKTVVALHRAAYLLYNHRNLLARRGVLVVGPSPTFVRYIDQVLPSLGETDVVMATVGDLYPGISTARVDHPQAAVVKGDLRMVDVLAGAVRHRQWVPEEAIEFKIDGSEYRLDRMTCLRARELARSTELPHNRARRFLIDSILDALTQQALDQIGREYTGMFDPASVRAGLAGEETVHEVLDRLWPELTPHGVLAELSSDPEYVAAAVEAVPWVELSGSERAALLRSDPTAWTIGDVPLLDELAVLLGPTDAIVFAERRAAESAAATAAEAAAYAEHIREEAAEAQWSEDEERKVAEDTTMIADRYSDRVRSGSIADQALLDREWEFGYAIVDEAQELSPMAWRLLARRCPGRSMTVVGDIAQTGAPDGVGSWAEALAGLAGDNWRVERLSLNYRTPAPIMQVATDLLRHTAPELSPPSPVRASGEPPWTLRVSGPGDPALTTAVERERARLDAGTIAVIAPPAEIGEVADALRPAVPDLRVGGAVDVLDAEVAVLTPVQAKGLEFDVVIVVDPTGILAGSARGSADLYVALTRATRRLGVVHRGDLPPALSSLR